MDATKARGAEMTDTEVVLRAVRQAQAVLADYIDPTDRDCESAVRQLLRVLDDENVVIAMDRLDPDFSASIAPRI